MTGLEIVLIIAGFVCLCVSFFVSQKKDAKEIKEEDGVQVSAVWTEKEEQLIQDRVNEILLERQNELVDETEDKMNRLCNEKIMAVDEFSKQLLEKIENNHQEVIFMYNMLNEKEKEIKTIVTEPVKVVEPETVVPKVKKEPQTAIEKMQEKEEVAKKETKQTTKIVKTKPIEEKSPSAVPGSVNLQIQKMHKEGKSVLEISKELNIGQGEVKLVIALYGGKK